MPLAQAADWHNVGLPMCGIRYQGSVLKNYEPCLLQH